MKPYTKYRVRVRMRSDGRYRLKPGLSSLDGRELTVTVGWRIDADDSALYAGEWALRSLELDEWGITWIASGDVEVLEEIGVVA